MIIELDSDKSSSPKLLVPISAHAIHVCPRRIENETLRNKAHRILRVPIFPPSNSETPSLKHYLLEIRCIRRQASESAKHGY